jgi:ribosomal protein S18 acetylase RimI-like enzyme
MKQSSIRWANELDAEDIARIHVCSWQQAYKDYIPESILNDLSYTERTELWSTLLKQGTSVLVLEADNKTIGFVSMCPFRDEVSDKNSAEISAMYLHPDYWRQGFGAKLCLAALKELANKGYKNTYLWVLSDNIPAQLFYKQLGFVPTSTKKLEEFYEGGALLTEVLYKKVLFQDVTL